MGARGGRCRPQLMLPLRRSRKCPRSDHACSSLFYLRWGPVPLPPPPPPPRRALAVHRGHPAVKVPPLGGMSCPMPQACSTAQPRSRSTLIVRNVYRGPRYCLARYMLGVPECWLVQPHWI